MGTLRGGLNKEFIFSALLTSGGLIAGVKSASLMARIPFMDRVGRFSGLINVILGGILAAKIRNPKLKALFVGYAAGGAYNLIAMNIPQLSLTAIQGDELLGVDVNGAGLVPMNGGLVPMNGVQVGGENWGPEGNW